MAARLLSAQAPLDIVARKLSALFRDTKNGTPTPAGPLFSTTAFGPLYNPADQRDIITFLLGHEFEVMRVARHLGSVLQGDQPIAI